MVNKTITFLLMGIVLLSLVSATTYRKGEEIPIRITGAVNGSISTVNANITVYNPHKEVLIAFGEMTKNYTTNDFNYTILGTYTQTIGEYTGMVCFYSSLDSIKDECVGIDFEVTTIGEEFTVSQSILYFLLLLVLGGLFIFCFYASIKIPWVNEKNSLSETIQINYKKYLKLLCIVFTYLLLLWLIYIGWNLSFAFANFGFISTFFQALFYMFIALTIPVVFSIFLIGFIAWIKDKKLKSYLNMGVNVDI